MNEYIYCGFWRRFLAKLIDLIIIFLIYGIWIVLYPAKHILNEDMNDIPFEIVRGLISLIGYVFYHVLFIQSYLQATLGKKLLKIKVITLQGKTDRLTFLRSLARELIQYIIALLIYIFLILIYFSLNFSHDRILIFFLISLMPILLTFFINTIYINFSKEKIALHDIICSTRVVRNNKSNLKVELTPGRG